MLRRNGLWIAAAGLALLGVPSAATAGFALNIDSFASPSGGQIAKDTTADGMAAVSSLGSQPVLGGSREIFADKIRPATTRNSLTASANEYDSGVFNFDQYGTSVLGWAKLIYDGGADGVLNTTGLVKNGVGVDLTAGGTDAGLLFSELAVTGSGLTLTANLYDAFGGTLFLSRTVTFGDAQDGDFFLSFVSSPGEAGEPALRNVGAVEILIQATRGGSDLSFKSVSSVSNLPPSRADAVVVPEPGTLSLIGLGAIGFAGTAFRKRRVAARAV